MCLTGENTFVTFHNIIQWIHTPCNARLKKRLIDPSLCIIIHGLVVLQNNDHYNKHVKPNHKTKTMCQDFTFSISHD